PCNIRESPRYVEFLDHVPPGFPPSCNPAVRPTSSSYSHYANTLWREYEWCGARKGPVAQLATGVGHVHKVQEINNILWSTPTLPAAYIRLRKNPIEM